MWFCSVCICVCVCACINIPGLSVVPKDRRAAHFIIQTRHKKDQSPLLFFCFFSISLNIECFPYFLLSLSVDCWFCGSKYEICNIATWKLASRLLWRSHADYQDSSSPQWYKEFQVCPPNLPYEAPDVTKFLKHSFVLYFCIQMCHVRLDHLIGRSAVCHACTQPLTHMTVLNKDKYSCIVYYKIKLRCRMLVSPLQAVRVILSTQCAYAGRVASMTGHSDWGWMLIM